MRRTLVEKLARRMKALPPTPAGRTLVESLRRTLTNERAWRLLDLRR